MMTQQSVIAQQAYILRNFGVTHWVQKDTLGIVVFPYCADRFHKNIDDNTKNDNTKDIASTTKSLIQSLGKSSESILIDLKRPVKAVVAGQSSALSNDGLDKAVKNTTQNDIASTPDQTKTDTPIKYELEGIRVGDWVLMVDVVTTQHEERSIWLSLKSAMSNWATQNEQLFGTHRISYPMNDEMKVSPTLAQKCLDGFVLRLQMLGDFTQKVAFLNVLPDGVDYFGETMPLPSLTQMNDDGNLKKLLWQQVVGGH